MTGFYSPYTVSAQLLQKHQFCTLDAFQSFIKNNEYTHSYHLNTVNRSSVKGSFVNLQKTAPFSGTIRFPDNFYIDMDCAKIRAVTKLFWNAIFRFDLWEQKEVNHIYADRIEYINNVTDVRKPLDEAFTKFAEIIMSTDSEHLEENGIYCRYTFEKKYGLIWHPKCE